MDKHIILQPSFQEVRTALDTVDEETGRAPNVLPVYSFIEADELTPATAYLKLTNGKSVYSFLFESTFQGEMVGRYSVLGTNPRKVVTTGNGFGPDVDPLTILEEELDNYQQARFNGIPALSGGAIGYVAYDCIRYFEPRTARKLKDDLHIPESIMMLFDTVVAFDHVFQRIQVIHNIHVNSDVNDDKLHQLLEEAGEIIRSVVHTLRQPEVPNVYQPPIPVSSSEYESNIGKEGYESHVRTLKKHIKNGDIFQAVPSQRLVRKTVLHPFNAYRHLRTVNPSPYLFYIDYINFQIVGASPELLVKTDVKGRVVTHPIAGTVKRGKTADEDDKLAQELLSSLKDRAEHVMLVDLARNDINRVCDPLTTNVDRLMNIERFSHVMHIVSQVSGTLRPEKTRFDAFRSIFPAGTVSGAPKVKAMEIIGRLEGERRGVYAGAVGHWGYDRKSMDTCIALRTMLFKDGAAYLQAGGGIVFDSDPYDEYVETLNKLGANMLCITQAEEKYSEGPRI